MKAPSAVCPTFRPTGLARFERAAYRLGGGRSILLSYNPRILAMIADLAKADLLAERGEPTQVRHPVCTKGGRLQQRVKHFGEAKDLAPILEVMPANLWQLFVAFRYQSPFL